jgi:hypothetical protein
VTPAPVLRRRKMRDFVPVRSELGENGKAALFIRERKFHWPLTALVIAVLCIRAEAFVV